MNKNIAIKFENVTKTFYDRKGNGKKAVDDVSFEIYDGEFITILGSSGCGKSTVIKMINRLIELTDGNICYYGKNIKDMDEIELRREIGYVVQNIGLFPHMTVEKNIGTVPELLKWDKDKTRKKTAELLELVHLNPEEYMSKYPDQLSGGQQQRVGVARALAANPKVMLLDEPFGAIDAITRSSLQQELLKIHNKVGGTFIFITHDISEALLLGTRVLIMDKGKICRFGTPEEILKNPGTDFVKNLIDTVREQNRLWSENL